MLEPLQASGNQDKNHYLLIDLIRSVAAILIIFWHWQHFFFNPQTNIPIEGFKKTQPLYELFWPIYEYGHSSVQLFWAISGFVFSVVYQKSKKSTGDFFINRVARLYPLHFITLMIVASFQFIAFEKFGHFLVYTDNSIDQFGLHLIFASNWLPHAPYSFNAPIWSVSVEILIYAIFWFSLPILFRFGLVNPIILIVMFQILFQFTDYNAFKCGVYFFMGCMVYVLHQRTSPQSKFVAAALAAAMGCFGFANFLFCFAILATAVALEELGWCNWLHPLRWLGDSTYGIYLWHFPLQLLLMLTLPMSTSGLILARQPWFLAAFILVLMVIALTSYHYVEKPARKYIRNLARSRTSQRGG